MQVFKTRLEANSMFLEARSQAALQECCSKHSRICAHNPCSVHQLLVQMKYSAQNKNNEVLCDAIRYVYLLFFL